MNPYWLIVGFTLFAQFFVFLRWLHRRMRDEEIRRAFARDMAANHLPHIYHALRLIASRLDIELEPPPPMRFLEFNNSEDRQDRRR